MRATSAILSLPPGGLLLLLLVCVVAVDPERLEYARPRPDMPATLCRRCGKESGVSLRLCGRAPDTEPGAEFGAGVDVELAVGAGEVGFHRLGAHEQLCRHLAVGETGGGQFGHAPLRLGQLVWPGAAEADLLQLPARLLRPQAGARALKDLERLPE